MIFYIIWLILFRNIFASSKFITFLLKNTPYAFRFVGLKLLADIALSITL